MIIIVRHDMKYSLDTINFSLFRCSGIFTGSVYKDLGLLKSGFPAENIHNSSVREFIDMLLINTCYT